MWNPVTEQNDLFNWTISKVGIFTGAPFTNMV